MMDEYDYHRTWREDIQRDMDNQPCITEQDGVIETSITPERIVANLQEIAAKVQQERSPKARRHQDLLDGLHDTFIRKNHDYGDSFAETFKEFGIISFIVRAQDKWNRIKSLSTDHKSAKVAESLQDTLLDLANYCIMAAMELEEK